METRKTMDDLREHLLSFAPEYPIKIGYVVWLMLEEHEKVLLMLRKLLNLIHMVEPEKPFNEECLSTVLHNMRKVFTLKRSNLIGDWQRLMSFLNEQFDVPFLTQPPSAAQSPEDEFTSKTVKSELEDESPSSPLSTNVKSELEDASITSSPSLLPTTVKSEPEDELPLPPSTIVTSEHEHAFTSSSFPSTGMTSEHTPLSAHPQRSASRVVRQLCNKRASETTTLQLNNPVIMPFIQPMQPSTSAESQSLRSSHKSLSPKKCKMNCDLSALVHDKKSSVAFLQHHGILHSAKCCDKNHVMVLSLSDRQDRWRCNNSKCRLDIPIRQGTWLQGSRLPYRKIILFLYYWSQELTSISFCQLELGMSETATVQWSNYLREVCANKLLLNPVVIGGPNTTVEIDEALFTSRKIQRGQVFSQQWVFGGICHDTGECFLFCVPDRTTATLLPLIKSHIRPGTTVVSDLWRSYGRIDNIPEFTDLTVNHAINFVEPTTGTHTQCIERMWRTAKERNKRQNGTHRNLLDSYMCEFMWRQCIKCAGLDVFNAILADIVVFWPPQ